MTYDEARAAYTQALTALLAADMTGDTGMTRLCALEILRTQLVAEIEQRITAVERELLGVR